MNSLGIEIPPFILHRRVKVSRKSNEIALQAMDLDGTPATIFSSVSCGDIEFTKEPFIIKPPVNDIITLNFFGHYNEPPLNLQVHKDLSERYYDLKYNPLTGIWIIEDKGPSVEFFHVAKRQLTELQKIPTEISKTKPPISVPSGGFSVYPKSNCPHYSSQVTLGVLQKVPTACQANTCTTCNDKTENWLCMSCGNTYCSRYINGDAKKHFKECGHAVSISFSDLSIWCYSCNDYITHENLKSFVDTLSATKFS